MSIKKLITGYFLFSKKDRVGIISLVILILVIYSVPRLFSRDPGSLAVKETNTLEQAIDTLNNLAEKTKKEEGSERLGNYRDQPDRSIRIELFNFDPNTLPVGDWQRLGLSEKTSRTIENYRNKGGRFYKPEDLKKIWGLPPGFFERVRNYIRIEAGPGTSMEKQPGKTFEKEEKKPLLIDINEADSGLLVLLPGIGPKLASRIVSFREKLGGFYEVGQIAETYGLPDSTFQKIKSRLFTGDSPVRKLNINTASKEELRVHPYLKWPLANAIVEYRTQHGEFKNLDEIRKIGLIDEVVFMRVIPYLSL